MPVPIDFRGESLLAFLALEDSQRREILAHLRALGRGVRAFGQGAHDFLTEYSGFRLHCSVDGGDEDVLAVTRLERLGG